MNKELNVSDVLKHVDRITDKSVDMFIVSFTYFLESDQEIRARAMYVNGVADFAIKVVNQILSDLKVADIPSINLTDWQDSDTSFYFLFGPQTEEVKWSMIMRDHPYFCNQKELNEIANSSDELSSTATPAQLRAAIRKLDGLEFRLRDVIYNLTYMDTLDGSVFGRGCHYWDKPDSLKTRLDTMRKNIEDKNSAMRCNHVSPDTDEYVQSMLNLGTMAFDELTDTLALLDGQIPNSLRERYSLAKARKSSAGENPMPDDRLRLFVRAADLMCQSLDPSAKEDVVEDKYYACKLRLSEAGTKAALSALADFQADSISTAVDAENQLRCNNFDCYNERYKRMELAQEKDSGKANG